MDKNKINIKTKLDFWKDNIDTEDLAILNSLNEEEIYDSFYKELEFGTAGLRGKIGIGTNRINKYIVAKVSYGFGKYIINRYIDNPSVVISFDNRRYSLIFSRIAANIFASLNIKVYLFEDLRPTPELSFAIRYLKASGGVMITASHNPNDYNGYKVYDEAGCQLTPDLITDVIKEIDKVSNLFDIKYKDIINYSNIELIGKKIDDKYLEQVKTIKVNELKGEDKKQLKVVFTPLHGTGSVLTSQFLISEGYNIDVVEEQMVNDSFFSTVPYPNPEEKDSFLLAIKKGKEVNADILIATDPDADRMGIAIKQGNNYCLLTGNQTGAIILDYLAKYKEHDENYQVYSTIVTSEVATLICKKYNLTLNRTLTGFKYIGEQARLIENTNKTFFFGYEESYGYVIKDFVRDKDSIQACYILLELATFYYTKYHKTLLDVLDDLYNTYGYFLDLTSSISFEGESGLNKMNNIMKSLRLNRMFKINNKAVQKIEDYNDGNVYYVDGSHDTLALPKANVLKYIFEDGGWITVRPSGTEPKIKIYYSLYGEKEEVNKFLNSTKEFINRMFI